MINSHVTERIQYKKNIPMSRQLVKQRVEKLYPKFTLPNNFFVQGSLLTHQDSGLKNNQSFHMKEVVEVMTKNNKKSIASQLSC